jgi:uncharacterized alpha/beta hydrolase family protein
MKSPLRAASLVAILMFVVAATGCSFLTLKKDLKELDTVVYYTGTVSESKPTTQPVIVVLYSVENGQAKPVMFDLLPYGPGTYHLIARGGDYHLLAFEDRDHSFDYDKGEPIGFLATPPQNARADLGKDTSDRINIDNESPTDPPPIFGDQFRQLAEHLTSSIGEVTTLDDPRFSDAMVNKGVYQPIDFYEKHAGPRLYLLQPYDLSRIPVVFIHGMFGSPRAFRDMIAALDKSRFQPWVYYWPTGMRVELSAWVLDQSLEYMSYRHGVNKCDLVGYSMGGLVARTALNIRAREHRPLIVQNFISISTPWGGDPAATSGVDLAPIVVPSWRNMDPSGTYMNNLFDQSWPPGIRYSLFFGYGGGGGSLNSDGTVSLKSVLKKEAQDRAAFIYGFDDNHETIPTDPDVMEKLSQQLDWPNKSETTSAATRP